jgi:hypothetical protein
VEFRSISSSAEEKATDDTPAALRPMNERLVMPGDATADAPGGMP